MFATITKSTSLPAICHKFIHQPTYDMGKYRCEPRNLAWPLSCADAKENCYRRKRYAMYGSPFSIYLRNIIVVIRIANNGSELTGDGHRFVMEFVFNSPLLHE